MIDNDILRAELAVVAERCKVEVIGFDGQFYGMVLRERPLPRGKFVHDETPGISGNSGAPIETTDVLLRINKMYPHAAPDMFWVRPFVRLATGAIPQAAEHRESHFGLLWQRFSWHLRSGWTPIHDTLDDYVAFVDRRLAQGD